jgi:hypothetical protein
MSKRLNVRLYLANLESKTLMKTKLIGAIAGVGLLAFLFIIQYKTASADRANPNRELVNMHFSYNDMHGINSELKIDTLQRKIVAFVSPTCPHCINFLHYLQNAGRTDFPIIVLFRDSGSDEAILNLIKTENLSMPLFAIKPNQITAHIKFVPTFLLVDEKNLVANAITGTATNKEQFDLVLKNLTIQ